MNIIVKYIFLFLLSNIILLDFINDSAVPYITVNPVYMYNKLFSNNDSCHNEIFQNNQNSKKIINNADVNQVIYQQEVYVVNGKTVLTQKSINIDQNGVQTSVRIFKNNT